VITNPRDRLLFGVAYAYGFRVGEIARLDRDDVDLERGRIRIRRLKGGLSAELPIFKNLLPGLGRYLEARSDTERALFAGRQGRLGKRRIQNLFRHHAVAAGLPCRSRHVDPER
jgi:site-specific recombinase XerC